MSSLPQTRLWAPSIYTLQTQYLAHKKVCGELGITAESLFQILTFLNTTKSSVIISTMSTKIVVLIALMLAFQYLYRVFKKRHKKYGSKGIRLETFLDLIIIIVTL